MLLIFFLNICHISNTVFTPTLNNHNKTNTWYACIYIKDLQIQLYSKWPLKILNIPPNESITYVYINKTKI